MTFQVFKNPYKMCLFLFYEKQETEENIVASVHVFRYTAFIKKMFNTDLIILMAFSLGI